MEAATDQPFVAATRESALPAGTNLLFVAEHAAPFEARFAAPFPERELGVWFEGRVTLPAFGLFCDVEEPLRSRVAAQVVVHRHEGPDDFVVELAAEAHETRLLVGRTPAPATLGAAIDAVAAHAGRSPTLLRRWLGKTRLRASDVLKMPPLEARDASTGAPLLRLDGGGGPRIEPGARTLGRGELYERYFVCDAPFLTLVLDAAGGEARLALWVEAPERLAPAGAKSRERWL